MNHLQEKLVGALVGIARATDGNEHFITPELTVLVRRALTDSRAGTDGDCEMLLNKIEKAKRQMVPNCFLCDNPCGRTSDFRFSELKNSPEEVIGAKMRMLRLLQDNTDAEDTLLYDVLFLFGMEMKDTKYLVPTIQKLEQLVLEKPPE